MTRGASDGVKGGKILQTFQALIFGGDDPRKPSQTRRGDSRSSGNDLPARRHADEAGSASAGGPLPQHAGRFLPSFDGRHERGNRSRLVVLPFAPIAEVSPEPPARPEGCKERAAGVPGCRRHLPPLGWEAGRPYADFPRWQAAAKSLERLIKRVLIFATSLGGEAMTLSASRLAGSLLSVRNAGARSARARRSDPERSCRGTPTLPAAAFAVGPPARRCG
jgi:hypothetical protein